MDACANPKSSKVHSQSVEQHFHQSLPARHLHTLVHWRQLLVASRQQVQIMMDAWHQARSQLAGKCTESMQASVIVKKVRGLNA